MGYFFLNIGNGSFLFVRGNYPRDNYFERTWNENVKEMGKISTGNLKELKFESREREREKVGYRCKKFSR